MVDKPTPEQLRQYAAGEVARLTQGVREALAQIPEADDMALAVLAKLPASEANALDSQVEKLNEAMQELHARDQTLNRCLTPIWERMNDIAMGMLEEDDEFEEED